MKAETAAMIMMSGSADLEDITITENGEYESVDHDGFKTVTVEVPTMVECAEEVAEILGVDTSQEWDCDDIKTKAQEVVDENEELKEENDELKEENESLQEQLDDCHDCKDQVVAAIQQYIPDYDPAPGECPSLEIPNVYQKGRDDEEDENPPGYTLPQGTDLSDPDVLDIIAGNPVTDNNTGATLGFQTYTNPDNSWGAGIYVIVDGIKTDYWYITGGTAVPVDHFSDTKVWVTDPTTGDWSATVTVHWGIAWNPTVYTGSGRDTRLIGYGSTSDTYTVKNN